MKVYFDFEVKAAKLFKLFLPFWILTIILFFVIFKSNSLFLSKQINITFFLILNSVGITGTFIINFIYTILFARILVPSVSFDNEPFGFSGKVMEFFWLNIKGILLSMITLFIYTPWYYSKIISYLIEKTSYKQKNLKHTGRGIILLGIILLTLLLPMVLLVIIITALIITMGSRMINKISFTELTAVLVYIFIIPMVYKLYQWICNNINYDVFSFHWNTKFWKSIGIIFLQLFLTIITVGLYWPAGFLILFRYFTNRSAILKENNQIGVFGFTGRLLEGFLLFWGQFLLCIITLGIYFPWAYGKAGKWLLANTYFQYSQ